MFSLDRSKNDTSITLDLLRAVAAQMVCIGHTINISGTTVTYLPNVGVMLFFVLSGFVIAYTIATKSRRDPGYGLPQFAIDRVARIYSAYLPAMAIIAAVDFTMIAIGRPLGGDPTTTHTLVGNFFMLQGVPNRWGVATFGSAGHLTSLAVEFHIYFFVGGLAFLAIGRTRLLAVIAVLLFSAMPLGYFTNIPNSDRALFVLWLLGFGAYFFVQAMKIDRTVSVLAGIISALLWVHWFARVRTPGDDYNIAGYPIFAAAFLSTCIAAQGSRVIASSPTAGRIITTFADYSFSLFLLHFTLVKVILSFWPHGGWPAVATSVVAANLAALLFAIPTEKRHRDLARWLRDQYSVYFKGTHTDYLRLACVGIFLYLLAAAWATPPAVDRAPCSDFTSEICRN